MALTLELHSLQDIWYGISNQAAHAKMVATALFLAVSSPSISTAAKPATAIPPIAEADKIEWGETRPMVYQRHMK